MAAPAPQLARRAPSLAAVEECWQIHQWVRPTLDYLPRWKRWLFWHLHIPITQLLYRLGIPTAFKVPSVVCSHCGRKVEVENGGQWLDQQGVFTTRDGALGALANKPRGWGYQKVPVNRLLADETLTTHADAGFPKSSAAKMYEQTSTDVELTSRAQIEKVHRQACQVRHELNSVSS